MKIIFLDFDFVLNSRSSFAYHNLTGKRTIASPDIHAVTLLDYLLYLIPDLYIVVSSSWRQRKNDDHTDYSAVKENLRTDFGLKHYNRVIGQTPFDKERFRGREIDAWLRQSETEVFNYIIIDDDSDFLDYQKSRHVQTDENGFSVHNFEKAYALLIGNTDGMFSLEKVQSFREFMEKQHGTSI